VIHYLCTINVTVVRGQADYPKLLSYLNGMSNTSLLKAYLQGFVAYRTGHNDDAITFFDAAPKGSAYIKLPAMDYLLGCARLSHMDNDAPEALEDYIREFHGTNYIKDSYLKLADFYLLQNDAAKYEAYLKLVKTKGNTSDQKDQQALSEANDAKPDIDLLKARFYFDGGYYNKALAQLAGREDNSFKLPRDKIEYYYRLGRIYDKTGKFNDAVLYYQRAINFGKDTRYYFAANSALSIGQLYEVKHDFKKAADFYNQALDMKDHQYQTDIDNDAKAGLKRVGG
jgi:tetratricopeptide (TPR) repeat protein